MSIPSQLKRCRFNRVLYKDKKAFEVGWQKNPYTYEQIQEFFPKENYGIICGEEVRVLDDDSKDNRLINLFLEKFGETFRVRDHLYFKFENGHEDKIILFDNGEHVGEIQGEGTYVVGPGCYDDKTEMLTINGFKGIDEISFKDKIATINKKGILEYHKPIKIFRDKYIGDMVDIKSRSIDLFVTPNHRVYFKKSFNSKNFEFDLAKNIIGKEIRIKRNAGWIGKEKEFIKIPSPKPIFRKNTQRTKAYNLRESGKSYKEISKIMGLPVSTIWDYVYKRRKLGVKRIDVTKEFGNIKVDTFLKFLGWWISEGSISMPDYSISITQSEKRYYDEIKGVLKDLGVKFHYNKRCMSFRFCSKQLYKYLEPLRGSHNKYVPSWIKQLSQRQINIFLDSLFKGDGSFLNGNLKRYYTVSKKLSEDVIELLLKTGYNSTVRLNCRTTPLPQGGSNYCKLFVISVSKSRLSKASNIEKKEYNGEIWCVEVPNNTVFVKRNGKTCWCGNSIHPSGEIYEVKNDLPIKTIFYKEFLEVFDKFMKSKSSSSRKLIELTEEDERIIKGFKDKWIEKDRQNLCLTLAGWLRKEKKFGYERARSIVQKICEEKGDKDVNERLQAVQQTYWKDENEIKGISGLIERNITPPDFNRIAFEVKGLILSRKEDDATELITEEILKTNHIYTTRDDIKSEIWFYQEGIYIPNGKMKIKEISRKIYQEAYTPQRVNKVIAKVEADTMIEHDDFFKNESVEDIPVQNGILNIFTRELQPFTPKRIFFNKLPVTYDPKATCPNINQFFKDVLKDSDDTKVMFELIGFCLMKEYKYEKAIMLIGNGRNGKGKTLSLIKYFLGGENCCSIPLSQIHAASTSVCELYGRLANLAGDLSNLDLKDTGMFKQITGRDLITAKRKYLRDLFFTNYAKIIFACNELPKVYDLSDGFWSRWVLFEFPYRFIKEQFYNKLSKEEKQYCKIMDEGIIDKITTQEELNGLLNESLYALDRMIDNKGFSYSKGTGEVKNMWIRKSDSFTAFCIDLVEEDYDGKVTKKDLRKTYNFYCKRNKLPGCSDKAIRATLEDRYGAVEFQEHQGDRVWEGIKLKAILK